MSAAESRSIANKSSAPKNKLILGIDIGTTRGAVAVLPSNGNRDLKHQREPEPWLFADWKFSWGSGNEYPLTALYYNEDKPGCLPMTGHELSILLENATPFNTERYFRLWKILFHDRKDKEVAAIQKVMLARLEKLNKTEEDLLRDWVAVVYKELICGSFDDLPALKRGTIPNCEDRDIEIVVPVPPGRSTIQHDQVRKAFAQGPIKPMQVSLVSEPEASFQWWVRTEADKGQREWKIGTKYVVLDAGGGTACTVRYKLTGTNPPRFVQEFQSESIICGAETISENFEKLLDAKVPESVANRQWVIQYLLNSFNKGYKNYVGISGDPEPYSLPMPGNSNYLMIDYQDIVRCFAKPLERLISAIQRQVNLGSRPDYLIMGGGMCLNTLISNTLRKEFQHLNVCQLYHDKSHMVKGAVWLRSHQQFIVRRPLKYTVGIVTQQEVDPAIKRFKGRGYREEDTWVNERDHKRYTFVVHFLAKKGQLIESGQEIRSEELKNARVRYPMSTSLKDLTFKDVIYTINYTPGERENFVFLRGDGRLFTKYGEAIRSPEKYETIHWSVERGGIDVGKLESKTFRGENPTHKIKYAINLQMTDVNCEYSIKVFSSDKGTEWNYGSLRVDESITDVQQISKNLSRSFDFEIPRIIPTTGDNSSHSSDRRGNRRSERPQKRQRRTLSVPRAARSPVISGANSSKINRRKSARPTIDDDPYVDVDDEHKDDYSSYVDVDDDREDDDSSYVDVDDDREDDDHEHLYVATPPINYSRNRRKP